MCISDALFCTELSKLTTSPTDCTKATVCDAACMHSKQTVSSNFAGHSH